MSRVLTSLCLLKWSTLITSFVAETVVCVGAGDISGMLQAHQSMFEQRVDSDTVTFNIVLNALGRAGRTKEVCRSYRLMRKVL